MKCLVLPLLLLVMSCKSQDKFTARDVRIFKDTPVWDVAVAIRDQDTVKVRRLLEGKTKAFIDYQEKYFGHTLLNWAVFRDNYESAKILAEMGADPNIKDNDSTCAIINAANKFDSSYLKLLIKHGGNPNIIANINAPQDLRTPLITSAYKSLENVKILIMAGADPNYVYKSKRGIPGSRVESALISACRFKKIEIVKYLIIDLGVDYEYTFNTTISGKELTILYYLREMNFSIDSEEYNIKMEVVQYLKERGLDYWSEPIPDHYKKQYDQSYLEKY